MTRPDTPLPACIWHPVTEVFILALLALSSFVLLFKNILKYPDVQQEHIVVKYFGAGVSRLKSNHMFCIH
jgi:hypothetical protein